MSTATQLEPAPRSETANVHVQPGRDEEHRQQEQNGDLLEPFEDLLAQGCGILAGHDRAEHERSEDRVDPDPVRDVRRDEDAHQDDGEDVGREPSRHAAAVHQGPQPRSNDPEHHDDEQRGFDEHLDQLRGSGRPNHSQDHRQHRPRQDIIDGGTGQGQSTGLGPMHSPLGEDASQDRERRHRHGCADEQGEGKALHRVSSG